MAMNNTQTVADTFEAAGADMSAGAAAPLSVSGFLAARAPGNSQYFSFSDATDRSSRALPAEAIAAAANVSPVFTDAPVYRSVGATAGVAGFSLDAGAFSAAPELLMATPAKLAAAAPAVHIVPPAVPRPYVMSHQAWAVPNTKASAGAIAQALTEAFQSLDMDMEFSAAGAEFQVAAAIDFNAVRFNVKMYTAHTTTLVEFNLVSGPSMQYHAIYAKVVDALPASVAALCPASRRSLVVPAMPTLKSQRRCAFAPPSLHGDDSGSDVSVIKAGDAAPLLRMATSGCVPMQREGAAALAELSTLAANADVLVQDGVLVQMATLVSTSKDWGIMHAAVSTIANILAVVLKGSKSADSAVSASMAVVSGLIDEVRHHSRSTASDSAAQQSLRRQCCRALSSMALNAQLAGAVHKAGGLDVLVAAQRCPDAREAALACTAVKRIMTVVA